MAEAPVEVRFARTGVDRHRGFDELIRACTETRSLQL